MRLVPVLVLVGCMKPITYVGGVNGGEHFVVRCKRSLDKLPYDCERRIVEPQYTEPTPWAIAEAEREANAPIATRAAPTAASVARAIASPGVHRAVELCRAQLAPALPRFSFTLAVAPTGEMTVTPHDDPFAACASRALQGANVLAYDGEPVSFEETLVFDGAPGA